MIIVLVSSVIGVLAGVVAVLTLAYTSLVREHRRLELAHDTLLRTAEQEAV